MAIYIYRMVEMPLVGIIWDDFLQTAVWMAAIICLNAAKYVVMLLRMFLLNQLPQNIVQEPKTLQSPNMPLLQCFVACALHCLLSLINCLLLDDPRPAPSAAFCFSILAPTSRHKHSIPGALQIELSSAQPSLLRDIAHVLCSQFPDTNIAHAGTLQTEPRTWMTWLQKRGFRVSPLLCTKTVYKTQGWRQEELKELCKAAKIGEVFWN